MAAAVESCHRELGQGSLHLRSHRWLFWQSTHMVADFPTEIILTEAGFPAPSWPLMSIASILLPSVGHKRTAWGDLPRSEEGSDGVIPSVCFNLVVW